MINSNYTDTDLKTPNLQHVYSKLFARLRLSSCQLKLDGGVGCWEKMWRLGEKCNILGDQKHIIYSCTEIDRTAIQDIPELHELENFGKLKLFMSRIENYL